MLREPRRFRPGRRVGSYTDRMREYDGPGDRPGSEDSDPYDEGPVELIAPEDFLGPCGIPGDARRMGLDRNTEEGALIALAGSLDPAKLSHKIVAWVLLVAFAVPLMLGLVRPMY
jgi:hypothetical protein